MEKHHSYTLPLALLLVALGLFIRYHIGRRRFNRRGMVGLQQFPTYGRFIFTVTVERGIYLIGTLCLWAVDKTHKNDPYWPIQKAPFAS